MEAVPTPAQRFVRLSAYPYPAHSLVLDEDGELRMAYVQEGAHENRPVLLLHGPPTWSYLWRRVMPMLVEGGCRVVAPDLIGFGRSDKLVRPRDHRLDRHVAWLMALVEKLDLHHVTVVAHGAAGLLALRLMAAGQDRFDALVAVCPRFAGGAPDGEEPAGELVARGCAGPLSELARAGYDAPFADEQHAGLRGQSAFFAAPAGEEEKVAEKLSALAPVEAPLLAVAGERDELAAADWMSHVPDGGGRRRKQIIAGAGHYAPEDRGAELALAVLAFMHERETPRPP